MASATEIEIPWIVVRNCVHFEVRTNAGPWTACGHPAIDGTKPESGHTYECCSDCIDLSLEIPPMANYRHQEVLRVNSSDSKATAHRVIETVATQYENHLPIDVGLRALGVSAVNAALKAVIIARGRLAERGIAIAVLPHFETVPDEKRPGEMLSIVVLRVVER